MHFGTIKSHLWCQSTNHRLWVWLLHCMCVFMCVIKGSLYSLCVSLCIKVTSTAAVWTDILTLFQSFLSFHISFHPYFILFDFFPLHSTFMSSLCLPPTMPYFSTRVSVGSLAYIAFCFPLSNTHTQTQMPTHHRWEPVFVNLSDKDAVRWVTSQHFLPY